MPLLRTATHMPSRHGPAGVCGNGTAVDILILTITHNTANCETNSDFQPISAGGDGAVVQYCAELLAEMPACDH